MFTGQSQTESQQHQWWQAPDKKVNNSADHSEVVIKEFTDLMISFKKKDNQEQVEKLVQILRRIEAFHDHQEDLTRAEIMKVFGTVLNSLAVPDPKFPNRARDHAAIIRECMRLFV